MNLLLIISYIILCYYALPVTSSESKIFHHQIASGDCESALERDMVYHENIQKSAVPLIQRTALTAWCGDEIIYCIQILNEMKDNVEQSAVAAIRYGGVGHSFVAIDMQSQKGHGIDFLVIIFGKKKNLKDYGLGKMINNQNQEKSSTVTRISERATEVSTEGFLNKLLHLAGDKMKTEATEQSEVL